MQLAKGADQEDPLALASGGWLNDVVLPLPLVPLGGVTQVDLRGITRNCYCSSLISLGSTHVLGKKLYARGKALRNRMRFLQRLLFFESWNIAGKWLIRW